jgi:spermidine synthase
VVVATGISSVTTQLVSIREFLAQCSGNEYVIALIIFIWLIFAGLGTLLAHLVPRYIKIHVGTLILSSLVLVLGSVAQLLSIRLFSEFFFLHGSSAGFYPTLAFIALTIGPYALVIGFVLPLSFFVMRLFRPRYQGAGIYLTDNIGDVLGGALFSFLLVFFCTPFQSIFLGNLPLLLCLWLLFSDRVKWSWLGMGSVLASCCLIAAPMWFEELMLQRQKEGDLVHYQETRYSRIEVFQNQDEFILYIDGKPAYGTLNRRTAEYAVHSTLAQLDQVNSVCLLSAHSSMLSEISQYQPDTIEYLELDPDLASILFQYGFLKRISGLVTIHEDGRKYLQNTKNKYDAIIMGLTEPETFKTNRYYTYEFFQVVAKHLKANGVFCFSVQGYENYPSEAQIQKISTLLKTVQNVFPHVLLFPSQTLYFLSSYQPLAFDIPGLLQDRGIETYYISRFYSGDVNKERVHQLKSLLSADVAINTDTSPSLMQIMFWQWFEKYSSSPFVFYGIIGVLGLTYLVFVRKEEFILFSTGWMNIGTEILVILTFQILYGYVYFFVGLIVTVFLAGLCPGAWLGKRLQHWTVNILCITDLTMIGLLGIFLSLICLSTQISPLVLLLFGFFLSLSCGFQFPVALELQGGGGNAVSRSFSADLLGAATGALITSVILVPSIGLEWTLVFFIGFKCLSLISALGR